MKKYNSGLSGKEDFLFLDMCTKEKRLKRRTLTEKIDNLLFDIIPLWLLFIISTLGIFMIIKNLIQLYGF